MELKRSENPVVYFPFFIEERVPETQEVEGFSHSWVCGEELRGA